MEVFSIVVSVIAIIAYGFTSFVAIEAWQRMRNVQKKLDIVLHGVSITTALTMGHHVKESFDQVNAMKQTLQELVEKEQFEEAKQLKEDIDRAEQMAVQALEHFKETCGDGIADIVVTKVRMKNPE